LIVSGGALMACQSSDGSAGVLSVAEAMGTGTSITPSISPLS
jgi:hypothetical protein